MLTEANYFVVEYIENETMPLEGDGRRYCVYIDHKQSLVTDPNYDLVVVTMGDEWGFISKNLFNKLAEKENELNNILGLVGLSLEQVMIG